MKVMAPLDQEIQTKERATQLSSWCYETNLRRNLLL